MDELSASKRRKISSRFPGKSEAISHRVYSEDPIFQSFAEWVVNNGGYIADCLSISMDLHGAGFFLSSPAMRESSSPKADIFKLLSTPNHLIFSLSSPTPSLPKLLLSSNMVSKHAKLCFHLCSHILMKEKSSHWPYIRTLPEFFRTPLYFDAGDMQWLKGTNLGSGDVKKRGDIWREEWEDGLRILESERAENWEEYTWDMYLRTATIYSSRSFTSKLLQKGEDAVANDKETLPILIPLWDITNHKPRIPIVWQQEGNCVSMLTPEDITTWEIGRPVENNYGPKSNEELLMGYGFCIESNPVDTVAMKILLPALDLEQEKLRLSKASSKDWNDVFYLRPEPQVNSCQSDTGKNLQQLSAYWPNALLDLFRVLVVSIAEERIYATTKESVVINVRCELTVALQLKAALLIKFKTIINNDDKAVASDEPTTEHAKMARLYRNGQIAILQANLDYLDNFLSSYEKPRRMSLKRICEEDTLFQSTMQQWQDLDRGNNSDAFSLAILYKYLEWSRNNYNLSLDSGNEWWQTWLERVTSDMWYPYEFHGRRLCEEELALHAQFRGTCTGEFYKRCLPLFDSKPPLFEEHEVTLALLDWVCRVYDIEHVSIGGEHELTM